MDKNTCRRNLMKLNREELKSKLRKQCHWGFTNLCKAEMINLLLLLPRTEEEVKSQDEDPLEVLNPRKKDLMKICEERKIKYFTSMTKHQMIEVLKWNDEDPSVTVHPDIEKRAIEYQKKYHRAKLCPLEKKQAPRRDDLRKICKERKIKYATCMTKQQMIEVLKWNDEDSSVNVHPDVQKRLQERINDPDQIEKSIRRRMKNCSMAVLERWYNKQNEATLHMIERIKVNRRRRASI